MVFYNRLNTAEWSTEVVLVSGLADELMLSSYPQLGIASQQLWVARFVGFCSLKF